MYALGIDLGTTFTAAATWRNGHAEVASLGSKAAVIPSVVLLRDDETVLTGEAASRRGMSEPQRVAREFKRRFGDTTPILLGGAPHSAEALTAKMLRAVIDDIAAREGGQPARICISHPANWGPFKRELLDQVLRLANVEQQVRFTSEPEAAAAFYAHQQRIEPGAVVAVYDLGGGTFDATVLRKTGGGFEILGQPEGIERLGGIDFDAAVFNHVRQALQGKLEDLDEDDPTAIAAVSRLREECIAAKEALSSDTDTSIPVLLPNVTTEVRLTRSEFEAMVRPSIYSTIEALRRALRSAQVTPDQLHSVLLVGGSSRMPLVSQLVGAELGRPVAVDAHPKHAVALGAAWLAGGVRPATAPSPARPARPMGPPRERRPGGPGAGLGVAGAAAAGAAAGMAGAGAARVAGTGSAPPPTRRAALPPRTPPPGVPQPAMAAADDGSAGGLTQRTRPAPAAAPERQQSQPPGPPPIGPPNGDGDEGAGGGRFKRAALVGGVAVAIALGVGGVVWATSGDGDNTAGEGGKTSDVPSTSEQSNLPADEQCTSAIKENPRWVCLTSAKFVDGELVVEYVSEWNGGEPDINGGFHLHLWGSDGSNPDAEIMGAQAGENRGAWVIKDDLPAVLTAPQVAEAIGDEPKVCARVANGDHKLIKDPDGGYGTGNCVPITGDREGGGGDQGGPATGDQGGGNDQTATPPSTTEPPPSSTTEPPPTTDEAPTPPAGEGAPAEQGGAAAG